MKGTAKDVTSRLVRLRLAVGSRSVELAVPTEIPLADLLPAILRHAGQDLADQGVEHEGWVLQRLGQPPLDENRTTAELGLADGETVHLRPRSAALPEVDFDDLVDGIASQMRSRRDRWNDRLTRWMLLAFAGFALALGWMTLAVAENPLLSTVLAGASAAGLLVAGGTLARAKSATVTGSVLGVFGVAYAMQCGWFLPAAIYPAAPPAMGLVCAAVLGMLLAVLALLSISDAALLFVGILLPGSLITVVLLVSAALSWRVDQAAAFGLALCVVAMSFVPTMSFRLAGLSLPALPSSADELDEDVEPVPHQTVVERSAVATQYLVTFNIALAVTEVVMFTAVVSAWQLWQAVLALVTAGLLLLRARSLEGAWSRWPVLIAGGYGAAVFWAWLLVGADPVLRLAVLFPVSLVLVLVLLLCARAMPGRRPKPYWGRAIDIVEGLVAVALIPLLLAVLDVYLLVRGLAG
ncbi:type VII secretion integral membrane protein EccD [Saccharopolyspora shandongensis]|uniref:Type VII secretion integral membrane protein EccD n=1 Tax=Saccharopolyspora shandongensis TaxID=418495 RepID=A0A1H3IY37_9PSEU|nr:type VII secretion integral membrane protein EccD [Saccharopolyspora shandongensis]SDY32098.1 type VII secretion integral membrane protein EccD [Saccharopolyspora shandongensis]